MDTLSFIAELIKALAWPLTALAIFAVLRRPLLAVIPLLERLKYKDFEFDFGRRLEEAAAEVEALQVDDGGRTTQAATDAEILRLAEASPRAAILEAWIRIEDAAVQAARRKQVTITSAQLRSPHQLVQTLEEAGVIDARQAGIFHELRGLRNSAAHASEFKPSVDDAIKYVRLAHTLEQSLRHAAGAP